MLRRIFGLKRNEVVEGWRKLHNEELHNFYSLPSISRMIKPRKIRWAGHVASIQAKRNSLESQKEMDHQEDLDIGGRIIL
jgi:hypothetical protein